MNIFFSVIICCYNSEKYIRETLDSVINQSYKNWEIILINDGSTDKTEDIILDYKNKIKNLIYFKQDNKGFAAARNKAIELCNYDWIVIIDHDDICLKDRLKIHANQLNESKNCMLFFGDSIIFSDSNDYITNHFSRFKLENIKLKRNEVYRSLLSEGCFIDSETVLFNKSASMSVGNFNENYKYIADYDFFLRMGKIFNFSFTKEILSKWRIHDHQATQTLEKVYTKENILLLSRNISFQNNLLLNFSLIFKIIKSLIKALMKTNFKK